MPEMFKTVRTGVLIQEISNAGHSLFLTTQLSEAISEAAAAAFVITVIVNYQTTKWASVAVVVFEIMISNQIG